MDSKFTNVDNFFDLNSLNAIKVQSNQSDQSSKNEALEKAAKQFEAIFMQMLMKSMRKAQDVLESDSPFNSQSTKFYRDMHDQQLALELSNNGTLGLSDLIVRQLGGDSSGYKPSSILRNDGQVSIRNNEASKAVEKLIPSSDTRTIEQDIPFALSVKSEQTPIFEQPEDFVRALAEPAKLVQNKLKVPFEVVIAQAALETGWGKKIIKTEAGESSNNLFNIKADKYWQGNKAHKETLEFEQGAMVKQVAPFRVYDSLNESINDYISFLTSNPRYQKALEQTENVEHFLQGLQSAGYATDPNYATKILGTLRKVTSLLAK